MNSSQGESEVSGSSSSGPCCGCADLRRRFVTLHTATARLLHPPTASRGEVEVRGDFRTVTSHARLWDAFSSVVQRFPDRPALVIGEACISYAELGQWCLRVAHDLLQDSVHRPGDRIALMLDNGPEFIAAYFGVLAAGGVVVPLPPNIEWNRLERIVQLCGVTRILSSVPIVVRRPELDAEDCRSVDLNLKSRPTLLPVQPLLVRNQSLAMIMFTSGSSGEPKGVMLSDAQYPVQHAVDSELSAHPGR